VVQARKLIALQGIAGCGQQEFPRGLRFVVQGDLRGDRRHNDSIISTCNGTKYVSSVEMCGHFLLGIASGHSCPVQRGKA
jgi:hypothetical protein